MPGKILIVEDNSDFRQILVHVLLPLEYETIEAATANEGIEKALLEPPDLIIMDLGLPGLNGIEATRLLKQIPETSHIPVVAYTVWGEEFKDKALQAGMVEFLPKTTPPQVLGEVIERFLQGRA